MKIKRAKYDALKHELGRYKKKVSDDAKLISEMKEYIQGMDQTTHMSEAIIICLLKQMNVSMEDPALVRAEDITENMHTGSLCISVNTDKRAYEMFVAEQNNSAETEQQT